MNDIPRGVLSEKLQDRMRGRRLRSAVFLTFCFEPDFFEQEILPAVLDLPLSHVPAVRLVQLEDALKAGVDHVAVYYDRGALMAGAQSAKLDVKRIPITYPTGYFHPKIVLLLTEAAEATEDGYRPQSLIVAVSSANLTRTGWWENVEACHIEEAAEDGDYGFRADLLELIKRVKSSAAVEADHDALDAIHDFVRRRIGQRHRRGGDGILPARIYSGGQSVADFLEEILGDRLPELCLEVISPYFDKTDAAPLRELCERFSPREVRVFLPRGEDGAALCDDALYQSVRKLPNVQWAQLPADMLHFGKSDRTKRRTVHAKVYRFFHPHRRYEVFFVGSVNLTTAAHSKGGNFESAFLIEAEPTRVPDWWLAVDGKKPSLFRGSESDETSAATTALSIRFDWARRSAEAFWDAGSSSPNLEVSANGARLFDLSPRPPREWRPLPTEAAAQLARVLPSTSFLAVREKGGSDATILVQEEGMAHKPSILFTLTTAEILKYWALLTPEQRAAFIDERATTVAEVLTELGMDPVPLKPIAASMFDTFAGIYHGFHAFESSVLEALAAGREKEAEYRLLGQKYDSLPNVLARVLNEEANEDAVKRYVIVLTARQVIQRIEAEAGDFCASHRSGLKRLKKQIAEAERVREQISFGTAEERAAFLDWFEEWFLTRAEPMGAA